MRELQKPGPEKKRSTNKNLKTSVEMIRPELSMLSAVAPTYVKCSIGLCKPDGIKELNIASSAVLSRNMSLMDRLTLIHKTIASTSQESQLCRTNLKKRKERKKGKGLMNNLSPICGSSEPNLKGKKERQHMKRVRVLLWDLRKAENG